MKGVKLSVVQHIGLDLLQHQDTVKGTKDFIDSFRLARIAAGVDAEDVYPEYFVDEVEAGDDLDLNQTEVEYDYSGVQWQGAADAANDEEMLAQFMQGNSHVEVALPTSPGEWH